MPVSHRSGGCRGQKGLRGRLGPGLENPVCRAESKSGQRVLQSGKRLLVGVVAFGVASCRPVVKTTLLGPDLQKAPICRAAVAIFYDSLDVNRAYLKVANLQVGWGPDVAPPSLEQMLTLLSNQAARLGANGIIVGKGWRELPAGHLEPSIAILIPDDTGRVRQACKAQ